MVRAYILIQAQVGASGDVRKFVEALDAVTSAEVVSGPYDVIAVAAAPSMDELGKLVVEGVQQVEGVTRTLTCPVIQF